MNAHLGVAVALAVFVAGCAASGSTGGSATPTIAAMATATPTQTPVASASESPGIKTGLRPVWVAESGDAVWVANTDEGSISQIDPATGAVVATVKIPDAGKIVALAAGTDFVFAISVDRRRLDRIDVATHEVESFAIESDYGGLSMGGNWLWHAASSGELMRIDPTTGAVETRLAVGDPGPPASLVADGEGAWVASGEKLVHVTGDPLVIAGTWDIAPESQLAIDGDMVWAIGAGGTAVGVAMDTGETSEPITLPVEPFMADAAGGSLWLRGIDLDLIKVDPRSGATQAVYPIDGTDYPGGFVVDGDEAWIANLDRGTVSRLELAP